MIKKNGKYPLEVKLERLVDRVTDLYTRIPRDKWERRYRMFLIIAITLDVLAAASTFAALVLAGR